MIDLERVKEKAENIINFYLDSNWEYRFIGLSKVIILGHFWSLPFVIGHFRSLFPVII